MHNIPENIQPSEFDDNTPECASCGSTELEIDLTYYTCGSCGFEYDWGE